MGGEGNGHGEDEATGVVGVLAEEIDAGGRDAVEGLAGRGRGGLRWKGYLRDGKKFISAADDKATSYLVMTCGRKYDAGEVLRRLGGEIGGRGGAELVDGEPGLLVGAEGVEGGGAGVAEGVEVVDQRDAAVLEGELGDREDVLGLVEIVAGVAVGEALGLDVADPGLIDVGDDLVASGGFGEAGGVGLEAGGVLVALVAIEDADGNVDGEAGGVFGSGAVVLAFEGGVGGAVGDGEAGVGVGGGDAEARGGVVGAVGEGGLDELVLGLGRRRAGRCRR